MEIKNLIFAVPLLVGIVAYFWATSQPADSNHNSVSGRPSHRERTPQRDISSADELTEQLGKIAKDSQADEVAPAIPKQDVTALSVAELEDKLRSLQKSSDPFADPDPEGLARELGKKAGAAGISWILENRPELYLLAIDGWADADSGGAFQYICNSSKANPCGPDTLMKLLGKHAGNIDAFRDAADKVPWELFRNQYTNTATLTMSGDVRMWIESGLAQSLTENGLELKNLFGTWAASDLSAAISGWATWPDQDETASKEQLVGIYQSQTNQPEGTATLASSLQTLDQETIARIRKLTETPADASGQLQHSRYHRSLRALREMLPPPLPLPTEPGP